MSREQTDIRIDEYGDEKHESWLLVRANHISSTPGARLFGSDIPHQHYVAVTITRCKRRRDLNRDWLHGTEVLMEVSMSQSQWGAFVSSFGQGGGVSATLERYAGQAIPSAPVESRFDESHREVNEAGKKALSQIQDAYSKFQFAFENEGKKSQREALSNLGFALKNAPSNMEFAASSLTEHVEKVVTTARADIEAMALVAAANNQLEAPKPIELEAGLGGQG